MKIGEKIKQLRQSHNMTQPALSEALGIEQSYLSKIENNKAIPSSDIFDQILLLFNVTSEQVLKDLNARHIKQDLMQITALQQAIGAQQTMLLANRQRFLILAGACFTFGIALMAIGFLNAFTTTYYTYQSMGIVLPGESKEVFKNWSKGVREVSKSLDKRTEMYNRRNEVLETHNDYRGDLYFVEVEGGSRTFRLEKQKTVYFNHWNNAAKIIGIVLFSLCFYLLYVERRAAKIS